MEHGARGDAARLWVSVAVIIIRSRLPYETTHSAVQRLRQTVAELQDIGDVYEAAVRNAVTIVCSARSLRDRPPSSYRELRQLDSHIMRQHTVWSAIRGMASFSPREREYVVRVCALTEMPVVAAADIRASLTPGLAECDPECALMQHCCMCSLIRQAKSVEDDVVDFVGELLASESSVLLVAALNYVEAIGDIERCNARLKRQNSLLQFLL